MRYSGEIVIDDPAQPSSQHLKLFQITKNCDHDMIAWVMLYSTAFLFIGAVQASILCVEPSNPPNAPKSYSSTPNVPLILWHGLGDSFDSEGIQSVADLYTEIYPKSSVYTVHFGEDGSSDRHATFFGNLTDQVRDACEDLRSHTKLSTAPAANALGFSQGGQFIRALIQRCDTPFRNLVTFGSQHNGIDTFAACEDNDWWCKTWSSTLKSNTWGNFVQSNLIPAQYFRDPEDLDNYLEHSNFLADINNEREEKNESYKKSLAALDRFVMYTFEEEDVVHPKESCSFAELNETSGKVTLLRERPIYTEDWLGLKSIDMKGGLIFKNTSGKHMQIQEEVLREAFEVYMKPPSRKQVSNHGGSAQKPLVDSISQGSATEDVSKSHSQGRLGSPSFGSSLRLFLEKYLERYAGQFDPAI